jgi:Zn-dependent protease
LLLIAGFGWAKPVPINPAILTRRSPAAVMWVSLAGPLSNLVMAILASIPFRLGLVSLEGAQIAFFTADEHFFPTMDQLLYIFVSTNLLLMLFNLLPIAPLDGDKIVEYFFPPSWSGIFNTIRPLGPVILLAVVFLGVLPMIINPPLQFLMGLLVG